MATDIYATVTNAIIEQLEKGTAPWRRPWDKARCTGSDAPVNAVTGHVYSGINVLILGMHPAVSISGDPRFCTYKQAQERGWQVRKGEKSTSIVFFRPFEVENERYDPAKTDSQATRMIGILRCFAVFHVSQIDGPKPYVPPSIEAAPWLRPDATQIILDNSGAMIRIGGDRAFYNPATDHIQLPPDHAFRGPEHLAAVALHEMAHWTGARHRLNRDLSGSQGSHLYCLEELRAETASAFLGARLGLPCEIENHASYLDHYIGILKADKKAIFHAAADAQKISDYLLQFHPDYRLAHEEELSVSLRRISPIDHSPSL